MLRPNKLCRACARVLEEEILEEAFLHFQKFRVLYSTLLELKINDDDDLPNLLCSTCVGQLEAIESFKETCNHSIDTIRKLIIANLKEEPVEEIVSAELLQPIIKVENEYNALQDKKCTVQKAPNGLIVAKGVRPMCALCNKTFASMKIIRKHMKLELKRLTIEKKVKALVKKRPKQQSAENKHCPREGCGRFFKLQNYLDKHLEAHDNIRTSNWCPTCKKNFTSSVRYNRHMELYHKATDLSNLTCSMCSKIFASVTRLKGHIMTKHRHVTPMFACDTCNVRYATEFELNMHLDRYHNSDKRIYLCHHCGKAHSTKKAVEHHLIRKHSEPIYETCTICGEVVSQVCLLRHYRSNHHVQTKLQVFKCQICDHMFDNKRNLTLHIRIHTGERPYMCDLCGKSFRKSNLLRRHSFVHSGERPVHCKQCGKGMYSKGALDIHMNIHRREWIAQGMTGIRLKVYATSNKSKNCTEKKFANMNAPSSK